MLCSAGSLALSLPLRLQGCDLPHGKGRRR